MQSVIVLEINELPLKVLKDFCAKNPSSTLARVIRNGHLLKTYAKDVPENFLYPSQTWASLNLGLPYKKHQIHWYHDIKPAAYELYMEKIAKEYPVGFAGTLHTYSNNSLKKKRKIRFFIPSSFSEDVETTPEKYENFARLNHILTKKNARKSFINSFFSPETLPYLWHTFLCLSPKEIWVVLKTLAHIALHPKKLERLRNLQFPLSARIFLREMEKTKPSLGILFTNHVAGNMHRYWAACYPEDFSAFPYTEKWKEEFKEEIPNAMALLESYLKEVVPFCEKHDYMLILVSSMGQKANPHVLEKTGAQYAYRIDDLKKFVKSFIKSPPSFRQKTCMIPQYGLRFRTAKEAKEFAREWRAEIKKWNNISCKTDISNNVVTISVAIQGDLMKKKGKSLRFDEIGCIKFSIDDHHSGRHFPEGILGIYNSKSFTASKTSLNYLEFAPAMLEHFNIKRPSYMVSPSFKP